MVRLVLATLLVLVPLGCASAAAQEPPEEAVPERPNVVMILADDMAASDLWSGAMPKTQDLLVDRGTRFSQAHVTYSLCCPSRATTLRGQYAHNTRVLDNSTQGPVPGAAPAFRKIHDSTVATWLDDAGYRTGHVGKYMNGYDGSYVPPGWDRWNTLYGAFHKNRTINDDGERTRYAETVEDALALRAERFVKDVPTGEPFYLQVGSQAPHGPHEYDREYAGLYAARKAPRYPSFNEKDVSDKPRWLQGRDRLDASQVRAMDSFYRERLRSLRELDDLVGNVVSSLKEAGELDNTYVVFTSDNGWLYGEHRLQGKWNQFDHATRVPMVVRGPGVEEGAVRSGFALNNDLAPTFADLAGAEIPDFVDGRPLAPLLDEDPSSGATWRSQFLVESWRDPAHPPSPPTFRGVRTGYYYYGEYPGNGDQELYNYRADPHELASLHRQNAPVEGQLRRHLRALESCSGESCRAAEGR